MNDIDAIVKNFAPDSDMIRITIGAWIVTVARNEYDETEVSILDAGGDGSETTLILGQEGESQKL